ncbi:MAG: hypothetical protein QGF46_02795 [Planctomycetota bacterium]|jgi:hypothetical protein|nr:hypothetical protein [Planctomycetota bacterium]
MFFASDFELFNARYQGDEEWNGRRLDIRHRLQALGNAVVDDYSDLGIGLDRRESLHHPHHTNRKRVRRQRTMIFRDKKARKKLQSFLGKELGKDLDSARNNVHMQICIDEHHCWWGLRIDQSAWYDLNVLIKRAEEDYSRDEIVAACVKADNFDFELNGGGARPLSKMTNRDWRDIAGTVNPGENAIEVVRKMKSADVVGLGEEFASTVQADLANLSEFFTLCSWTLDSPNGATA